MAKYLIKAKYKAEGDKGLIKEGGTGRRAAVKQAIEAMGGTLESFYYAFGDVDCYVIVEVPDAVTGLALTLTINASGTVHIETVPLLTCEEVDQACHQHISYRPPHS